MFGKLITDTQQNTADHSRVSISVSNIHKVSEIDMGAEKKIKKIDIPTLWFGVVSNLFFIQHTNYFLIEQNLWLFIL